MMIWPTAIQNSGDWKSMSRSVAVNRGRGCGASSGLVRIEGAHHSFDMNTPNKSPRKIGLKRVSLWVVDANRPGFAAECRRQALRVSRHRGSERRVLRELEVVMDLNGWT